MIKFALSPFLIFFVSTKFFKAERSAACLAISVARMQPITLFLKTFISSEVKDSKKFVSSFLMMENVSAT